MGAEKHISDTLVAHSLKDLKKIIKRKRRSSSIKPVPVKSDGPFNDENLFDHTMKGVQEIEEFRKMPVYQKTIAGDLVPEAPDCEALGALEELVAGRRHVHLPDTQEYVEWIDRYYRGDIVKDLHRGRYSVQDYIDLHGVIVEDAEAVIGQFIKDSLKKGHQCIKIIHGRGLRSKRGPVLKEAVVRWLSRRFRKYVVAFVSARQCDGGLGAVYILLK